MEGLEFSEVMLSAVNQITISYRLDAEFFQKEYLRGDRTLGSFKTKNLLAVTSRIDVGFVGSMTQHYRDEGVPLIQTKNIAEFFVSDSEIVKITSDFHTTLQKSKVSFEDILIARSGSFGKAAIFMKTEEMNSSDIIIIKAKNDVVNPYYLTAFLNSKLGVNQMIRFASGGLQGHVNLTILEELKVPLLGEVFQQKIEGLVKSSATKIDAANLAYRQAETLLLDTLGMADFSPDTETVNIKSFKDSFAATGRLDAEYYQPKYDYLEKVFNQFSRIRLADLVNYPISSGVTPKAGGDDYTDIESGVPFVRAVDLQNGQVSINNFNYIKPDVHNGMLKRTQLKNNDFLFSIAGTVGRCAVFKHTFEANINQAVAILRFNDKRVNHYYLMVLFNSQIGKEFVAKYARQGLQTNLNLSEVGDLSVPMIDMPTQQKIAALVQQSFTLKAESERLLAVAKRAVEMAIEQDEAAALRYLDQQTLGVH